jgi:hypothetical protein
MNAEEYTSWLRVTRNYLTSGVRLDRIPGMIAFLLDDPGQPWRRPDNATFRQFVTRGDEHGLGHDWMYLAKVCSMQPAVWQRVLEIDLAAPGRRRTADERQHVQQIAEIKRQEPELSTREIAERVSVAQKTVVTVLQGDTDITDNVSNIGITPPASREGGNGVAYTLQRIGKKSPAVYERVIAGELSAHQAALQLGIRKRVVSVRMDDAASACATIAKHMDLHVIENLVRRLQETLDDRSLSIRHPPVD